LFRLGSGRQEGIGGCGELGRTVKRGGGGN